MRMNTVFRAGLVVMLTALCGCAMSYSWRSQVPERMRTVSVPTFRNESEVMEIGAVMARQTLRELQRTGTFRIASVGEAALEIQGTVKRVSSAGVGYDRRSGFRFNASDVTAEVLVSVIDKRGGRVLVDNRPYRCETTYTAGRDSTTAMRDASGRLAEDLARRVVDDLLEYDWSSTEER